MLLHDTTSSLHVYLLQLGGTVTMSVKNDDPENTRINTTKVKFE